MRAEASIPRSARISTSSMSSSIARSSLRLTTKSVIAVPIELEVRLSPSLRRRHQLVGEGASFELKASSALVQTEPPPDSRYLGDCQAKITPERAELQFLRPCLAGRIVRMM